MYISFFTASLEFEELEFLLKSALVRATFSFIFSWICLFTLSAKALSLKPSTLGIFAVTLMLLLFSCI